MSLHTESVPVLVHLFQNLQACLDKAEAHAQMRGFDPANYLGLRLAPDMLPFSKQVQIATDMAKGCAARLSGQEIPKWADDEATLAELRARLQKAIDFVQSVPASAFDGAESREIVLPTRNAEPLKLSGERYLRYFVLPNVYFHATTAYALLRHAGVELGKRDFIGAIA